MKLGTWSPLALLAVLPLIGQTQPDDREPKPASLSGNVSSSDGLPIRKALLTLNWSGPVSDGDDKPRPYTTTSDAEGKFLFQAIDPGQYLLTASQTGYLRQNYGASRPNTAGGTILSLSAGQSISALAIHLAPQILISGKVRDPDGDPVAFCSVHVLRQAFLEGRRQLAYVGSSQTDEEGNYKLRNLGPGKYYVNALPPRDYFGQPSRSALPPPAKGEPATPEYALVSTFYPGVIDPDAASAIRLASGTDRPGTDITMLRSPVFHVRGRFSGPLPRDRSDFHASIMRSSTLMDYFANGSGASSPFDKNGAFDLSPLPQGSYRITASDSSGEYVVLASARVEVGNHDVDNVVLLRETPVTLTGTLKIEDNADSKTAAKPSPEVFRMHLRSNEGTGSYPAVAKEDGTFAIRNIFPGEYRVNVYALPDGTYLKAIRFEDQDLLKTSLKVSAGAESKPIEIFLSAKAASLTGTVENAEGKPAPTASVTLIPDPSTTETSQLYRLANTDQDGRFSIRSIPPGKYRLYAWRDLEPGSQFDPEFLKDDENAGARLEIGESETAQVKLKQIEK